MSTLNPKPLCKDHRGGPSEISPRDGIGLPGSSSSSSAQPKTSHSVQVPNGLGFRVSWVLPPLIYSL